MTPMDVLVEEEEEFTSLSSGQESRFYTCHVCGDNWLSVKELDHEGRCLLTFVHQMGMAPTLKRTAQMHTPVLVREGTVGEWHYFLDDEEVEEYAWRQKLSNRRRVLKSICCN